MDNKAEQFFLSQATRFFEKSVDFERTFSRYMVLGNGTALALTFNYVTNNGAVKGLKVSMVCFAIALCLATLQHYIRALHYGSVAGLMTKGAKIAVKQSTERDLSFDYEDVAEETGRIHREETEEFKETAKKKNTKFSYWYITNGIVAALLFAFGLFWTILLV